MEKKTVSFKIGQAVYTVNDETKYISVKDANGVKVPESSMVRRWNNKLYVPIEILKSELGYNISNDSNNIWVGNKPDSLPQTSTNEYSHSSSNSRSESTTASTVTENMKLSTDNGWVCPQITSTSIDDVQADAKTLIRELEFTQNGSTSAKFASINGAASFVTTSVGPSVATEFSSIIFKGYYFPSSDGYMKKINQINPQVLKFYFPNSWEWIHNKFIAKDSSIINSRMTIDGRDTYFTSGEVSITVHMSKVGGTLGGNLPSSSGSIGFFATISNSSWEQSGNSWYFKKNDGTYAKGWLKDGGNWYFFDTNGIMKTGWIKDGGNWYFCWSNGQMATSTTISGYTLNENGALIN